MPRRPRPRHSAALTARATAGTTVDSRLTAHGAGSFSQAHHARGGAEGLGAREEGGEQSNRARAFLESVRKTASQVYYASPHRLRRPTLAALLLQRHDVVLAVGCFGWRGRQRQVLPPRHLLELTRRETFRIRFGFLQVRRVWPWDRGAAGVQFWRWRAAHGEAKPGKLRRQGHQSPVTPRFPLPRAPRAL